MLQISLNEQENDVTDFPIEDSANVNEDEEGIHSIFITYLLLRAWFPSFVLLYKPSFLFSFICSFSCCFFRFIPINLLHVIR